MKWPKQVTFIRHGESAYNILKKEKAKEDFIKFKKDFYKELATADKVDWPSQSLKENAEKFWKKFALNVSDYDTPLTKNGLKQALETGKKLSSIVGLPDIIFVSPYLRTRQTLEGLIKGWPELGNVRIVSEERIREQEHGMSTVYNDSRVYYTLQPGQGLLSKLEGRYEYRFLNGESVADVRDRVRSFLSTLAREYSEQNVLIVSHHLSLLSFRANLERWSREEFLSIDGDEKPANCGVTIYKGDPDKGKNGKLILDTYNKRLY